MKVTPWDSTNMKRALDEALVDLVLEETPLKENHRLVDFKLIIMFFSCVAGCIAQFYPLPFPDNRLLLAACVVVYFLLSAVYQYYTWYIEKDYIFLSKPLADGTTLALRTRLPRYDENYSIVVEAPQGKPGHTATASVGKFFTKAGDFSTAHFQAFLRSNVLPTLATAGSKKKQ